jgi:ClpP class serine protease
VLGVGVVAHELPRFYRTGLLALDPAAFGAAFTPAPAPSVETAAGGLASVVRVRGPLTYDGGDCQSYAAILHAADAAFTRDAPDVILHVSSPGGDVFGAFDCARALRARAANAGKRLWAFTESNMQSAGYALACAAERGRIVCSDVASVGSVGVMSLPNEITAADAAMGVKWEVLTSGNRKADGNPHIKMTSEARAAVQQSIDATAEVFFALVRESRGIDAQALQAASFVGAQAKAAGLVDHVMSWDALCALIASGAFGGDAGPTAKQLEEITAQISAHNARIARTNAPIAVSSQAIKKPMKPTATLLSQITPLVPARRNEIEQADSLQDVISIVEEEARKHNISPDAAARALASLRAVAAMSPATAQTMGLATDLPPRSSHAIQYNY